MICVHVFYSDVCAIWSVQFIVCSGQCLTCVLIYVQRSVCFVLWSVCWSVCLLCESVCCMSKSVCDGFSSICIMCSDLCVVFRLRFCVFKPMCCLFGQNVCVLSMLRLMFCMFRSNVCVQTKCFVCSDQFVGNQKLDTLHALLQTAAAEKEEECEVGPLVLL